LCRFLLGAESVHLFYRVRIDWSCEVPGREIIVIALTQKDMYIQGHSWRHAFSYREKERFAVVSIVRPMSRHPKSDLYRAVGSLEELDNMGEDS
jgi:hypothetical protein